MGALCLPTPTQDLTKNRTECPPMYTLTEAIMAAMQRFSITWNALGMYGGSDLRCKVFRSLPGDIQTITKNKMECSPMCKLTEASMPAMHLLIFLKALRNLGHLWPSFLDPCLHLGAMVASRAAPRPPFSTIWATLGIHRQPFSRAWGHQRRFK
jgi:hypothetical protein